MRAKALELARLDDPGLTVLDAGAGTGFTTEGIVARVPARQVTMLDQSPHQLARARAKPALAGCRKLLGDAEQLPFPDDVFDRYVSAGSIEYWPDPQRGIAEAYRVTKAQGTALIIGPVRPNNPIARRLAETWMLFPTQRQYATWMEAAGFEDVNVQEIAPAWYRDRRGPYALAVSGVKPAPGPSKLALGTPPEDLHAHLTPRQRLQVAARFVAGAAAGAAFVPIGAALALRARLRGG
jgi:MPBQ/MSBQ methyltransferase